MKHGSLFSGIGGFDLAAEWMGWENLFNCEWEEFPRKVLKHHFPNAKQYGDIKEFNAATYAGRIDILTGGFPCQPYSTAGKRKGKEDERHLWPEMLRVIRECSPRWVVGENVRGLCSWNGGLVFEEVCADLEACGYSVQPFILPAAGVASCPHRRDRVWFVAYSDNFKTSSRLGEVQSKDGEISERNNDAKPCNTDSRNAPNTDRRRLEGTTQSGRDGLNVERESISRNASDTDSSRVQGQSTDAGASEKIRQGRSGASSFRDDGRIAKWKEFPTVPPICGGDDGLPKELDGITFPKWRRESIKAYGNAIVPQVALQIFKAIEAYES